jgi:hypothetical protein
VIGAVSVAFDNLGNMYAGGRSAVYKIPAGTTTATIIAGSEDNQGLSSDGGLATAARFSGPLIVAPDSSATCTSPTKATLAFARSIRRESSRRSQVTAVSGMEAKECPR